MHGPSKCKSGALVRALLTSGAILAPVFIPAPAALAAAAAAEGPRTGFNIPAQDLGSALSEFARQSGQQLLYSPELVRGKRSSAVMGQYAAPEALRQLLAGSPIGFTVAPSGAFLLSGRTDGRAAADAQGGEDEEAENTIVVTGTSITGRQNQIEPVKTITRRDIERSGAAVTGELIRDLPQNVNDQITNPFTLTRPDAAITPNLRGLGTGATLVLINGRRPVNSASGMFDGLRADSFNINRIPLGAIERIEVLTDGGSAIYGSDAVGGVINVILRKDYRGAELNLRYGDVDHGHAPQRTASLVVGWHMGRFNILVGGEYFDQGELLLSERKFVVESSRKFIAATDLRSIPGNVTAIPGTGNLPGLNSTFAAIPSLPSGATPTLADFQATQGTLNQPINRSVLRGIQNPLHRKSAFMDASYEISQNVTAFLEASVSDFFMNAIFDAGGFNNVVVPRTNPFNPFGANVRVSFYLQGLSPFLGRSRDIGVTGGLSGRFGAHGSWDAYVSYGRSTFRNDSIFIDPAKLTTALAQTDRALALNVFGPESSNSPALLHSLTSTFDQNIIHARQADAGAKASFDLFQLPAGSVKAAAGVELRKNWFDLDRFNTTFSIHGRTRTISSAFSEISVPLLSPLTQGGDDYRLELRAAARVDHYSDIGTAVAPSVGIGFRPARTLLLRATYNRSFIAPSFNQTDQPAFTSPTPSIPIFDPKLNLSYVVLGNGAGNPDLHPEKARSLSLGAVLLPRLIKGLRASVDYFHIRYKDKILTPTFQQIVDLEAQLPARVVRSSPTGPIISLDQVPINLTHVNTDGFDFDLSYQLSLRRLGSLDLSLGGTRVLFYKVQDTPLTALRDRVATPNNPVKWQGRGSAFWTIDGLTTGFTVRYIDKYASERTPPTVHSYVEADAQATYRLRAPALFGLAAKTINLTAGVENLFNRHPPYFNTTFGYDSGRTNPLGRRVYVSMRLAI